MARPDPHSCFDDAQPRAHQLEVDLRVDFATRRLVGRVRCGFDRPASGRVDFDTRGLRIGSVTDAAGAAIPFTLHPEEPILGQRLEIAAPPGCETITIEYETSPEASGLQWLEPAQTEGRTHPFLFSQCQAIHARSLLPCQDCPRARINYRAALTVPEPLVAVMAAASRGERAVPAGWRTFLFEMPQPIPPYLFALAAGDLASRDVGPRSRVWAEPACVEAAAWEFADLETVMLQAEKLFGSYEWERFDLLVLPPSFPYGGMENPRLTFLTPTLLAGDRSLVDVVVHELAHAWTGNLVTNADQEHFWLNEGATVWAERRILEALHGPEAAALSWAVNQASLDASLARFGTGSPLTRLRTTLRGVDPDDAFSSIPYEKGARFLQCIEQDVGRARFDAFMRAYMRRFRFTSITTEEFVEFLQAELPGAAARVDAKAWLYETGMPAQAPTLHRSARLDAVAARAGAWSAGQRPDAATIAAWNPTEMLLFLQHLPRPLPASDCAWLVEHLAPERRNAEIQVEWFTIAARSDYEPALPALRAFLLRVGRLKYLRPLYTALAASPRLHRFALDVFGAAQSSYHGTARRMVAAIFDR